MRSESMTSLGRKDLFDPKKEGAVTYQPLGLCQYAAGPIIAHSFYKLQGSP